MFQVSVIIPVHNGANFVARAINSVLDQTILEWELIIVDDGSTDATPQVVKTFTDSRVKYVYQSNQGPNAARNAGIRISQGKNIAFLDADDWWLPAKLQAQLDRLSEYPEAGLVYCSTLLVTPDGELILGEWALVEGNAFKPLLFKNIVSGSASSIMIPKKVFERVGLFDEDFRRVEDWEMWLRIAATFPFAAVHQPLVYVTNRPGSNGKDCFAMHASQLAVLEKAFGSYAADYVHLRREALAAAHASAGRSFSTFNMYAESRAAFRQSLSLKPWNPGIYARWLLTFLGPTINQQGRRLMHRLLAWQTRRKIQQGWL